MLECCSFSCYPFFKIFWTTLKVFISCRDFFFHYVSKTSHRDHHYWAKRTVNFAVLVDHRIKLKEGEKKDKYLDLGGELKKLWNMKVTVIPIVTGALGTLTKGLVHGQEDLEIRRRMETIQTTALLRSARILRRVMETCCH